MNAFATALETSVDRAAALHARPGTRVLQRLNRVEYANSIHELLNLDVDVSALLPPDSMNRGFDNIADVLTLSPALMEGYIRAASKISRVAVGDMKAAPSVATFSLPRTASQMRHADGAPIGTRGGLSVVLGAIGASGTLGGCATPSQKLEAYEAAGQLATTM